MCVLIWYLPCFMHVHTLMRPSASMICSSNFLLDFQRFLLPFFIQNPWKNGSRTPSRKKSTVGTNFTVFLSIWEPFGTPWGHQFLKKCVPILGETTFLFNLGSFGTPWCNFCTFDPLEPSFWVHLGYILDLSWLFFWLFWWPFWQPALRLLVFFFWIT